ncbi:MAG: threonylcarbamoyl-AMP synthase [Betaproteobacteria bacterium]|nr:threonylcarbamoyl-AMP synthase [Betaproteobacteria bacterium]
MAVNLHAPTPESIERAADLLRRGELVAFPTETVYGLGADATNRDAVARIFAAKGRPADHPVIVHLAAADALPQWARAVPDAARRLAAAFWPGPLTLILPRGPAVEGIVTGGQDSVGLRVPAHPVAQALLAAFARRGGAGIAAPSANRFGRISPTTAAHVATDLGDAVAMILDGGACALGIESTIVAFDDDGPMLLRPGSLGIDALTRVLGRAPRSADASAPRASGTLTAHYAPHTRTQLIAAASLLSEVRQRLERDEDPAVLARGVARPGDFAGTWIGAPSDPPGYAHELYANLRRLDAARADEILIEALPNDDAWLALRDRLARAAAGSDDDRD